MPEPPRPKRLQMHLSTAVVMMFVAGILIWANSRRIEDTFESYIEAPYDFKDVPTNEVVINFQKAGRNSMITGLSRRSFGWPVLTAKKYQNLRIELKSVTDLSTPYPTKYFKDGIVIDICVALGILFAVWFVSEWWISRRTRHHESAQMRMKN